MSQFRQTNKSLKSPHAASITEVFPKTLPSGHLSQIISSFSIATIIKLANLQIDLTW